MAGKTGRPRRMTEPSRTWNIVFPNDLIKEAQYRAKKDGITPAALARNALIYYLTMDFRKKNIPPENDQPTGSSEYFKGVNDALTILKTEIVQPRFPSGQTLGDRLAQKILEKLGVSKVNLESPQKMRGKAD